ncbi:Ferroporti-1 [Rhypophila decipiens]
MASNRSPTVEVQPPAITSPMSPHQSIRSSHQTSSPTGAVPANIASLLYTSHFLSTWNSRLFEFGAVLFLASIFPDTLQPMSVYALMRCAAAIILSQPVGHLIDHGNRLSVVRLSILGQRGAVIFSCACFLIMHTKNQVLSTGPEDLHQGVIFGLAVMAACIEKLASIMNLVSVERDWVVVIAGENDHARREMNAKMRRIDLLCKLLGPLAISMIAIISTPVAIWATLSMNIVAVGVEYAFIARVYGMVPDLRRQRVTEAQDRTGYHEVGSNSQGTTMSNPISRFSSSLLFYFRHAAFLPSFSLALLYLTVLSFSGQMITYLISVGYTSFHVGLARTLGTAFELSATWAAPMLVRRIGDIRGGIWSLSWQMACLAAAVAWLFIYANRTMDHPGAGVNNWISATGLAVGVALSRVGLWGYDLCAQNIIQEEVEPDHRGAFSAVETSVQNLFELISYSTTIIFSRPDQFKWPVVISIAAVYLSGGLYATFVRKRRGHLFHAPPSHCLCNKNEIDTRG